MGVCGYVLHHGGVLEIVAALFLTVASITSHGGNTPHGGNGQVIQ